MIYDIIIIGSGPAGLAAAIYGERAKLNTLVIEKDYISGGQVNDTYEIDNYPGLKGVSGFELANKFKEHADALRAHFVTEEIVEAELQGQVKLVKTTSNTYEARTVIIATGARHKELGAKGENDYAGIGVSYCATCDGAFFKDKVVTVVGGGDVAVEDAIFLARGSRKVYLVHRREELRAAKQLCEKLFSLDNVEILWNSEVREISGQGKVQQLKIYNNKECSEYDLNTDGLFVAVGIEPNSSVFAKELKLDDLGYIVAGENCETNIPGVFAAGDVRKKQLRQVVTAVADGANAVTSAEKYINS